MRTFHLRTFATATIVALSTFGSDQAKPDQARTDEAAIRRTLAETERKINQDDFSFVDAFAEDAVIIAPGAPNIVGFPAIRALYTDVLKQASMEVHFTIEEVVIAGDLAFERGSYTFRLVDRASGKDLQKARNKHIHVLKRQPSGAWKTWRMMVNAAEPASAK